MTLCKHLRSDEQIDFAFAEIEERLFELMTARLGVAIDVESSGSQQPGTGGFGIYDHAFLSATWIGCQVAAGTGYPYLQDDTASLSSFIGCYAVTNVLSAWYFAVRRFP